MFARVRTILIVTIVTLFIWLFAEGEGLRTQRLRVDVALDAGGATRVLRVLPGQAWTGGVEARVEGSTAALDALLAGTAGAAGAITLTAGRELPGTPGTHSVDILAALRSSETLRQSGVTLLDVDPPSVELVIDPLVTRTVPVRIVAPDAELAGPPEPEPASVEIEFPESFASIFEGQPVAVTARLTPAQLEALEPGQPALVPGVRLEPPRALVGETGVSIGPERVDVSLTLRSRTDAELLASVPVFVRLPAAEAERWLVEVDEPQFLRDVRVSGPREEIERVRSGDLRVVAELTLTFDELERGITEKQADFGSLPTSLRFETADQTVRFRAVRRADAAGTDAP